MKYSQKYKELSDRASAACVADIESGNAINSVANSSMSQAYKHAQTDFENLEKILNRFFKQTKWAKATLTEAENVGLETALDIMHDILDYYGVEL